MAQPFVLYFSSCLIVKSMSESSDDSSYHLGSESDKDDVPLEEEIGEAEPLEVLVGDHPSKYPLTGGLNDADKIHLGKILVKHLDIKMNYLFVLV